MPDVQPPRLPPSIYGAIYRTTISTPSPTQIWARHGLIVELNNGGFPIEHATAIPGGDGAAHSYTMGRQRVNIPTGPTVMVLKEFNLFQTNRNTAALEVIATVALFDLVFTGLLRDKYYEGIIDPPGRGTLMPPSPIVIRSRLPPEREVVISKVRASVRSLRKMDESVRQRYLLGTRWYTRGAHSDNDIDKLLYYWMVLEVFPSVGRPNVGQMTAKLLIERGLVAGEYDERTLQSLFQFRSITRFRAKIVHDGIAYVPPHREQDVQQFVEILSTLAVTCLRILIDMDIGSDLDELINKLSSPPKA